MGRTGSHRKTRSTVAPPSSITPIHAPVSMRTRCPSASRTNTIPRSRSFLLATTAASCRIVRNGRVGTSSKSRIGNASTAVSSSSSQRTDSFSMLRYTHGRVCAFLTQNESDPTDQFCVNGNGAPRSSRVGPIDNPTWMTKSPRPTGCVLTSLPKSPWAPIIST